VSEERRHLPEARTTLPEEWSQTSKKTRPLRPTDDGLVIYSCQLNQNQPTKGAEAGSRKIYFLLPTSTSELGNL